MDDEVDNLLKALGVFPEAQTTEDVTMADGAGLPEVDPETIAAMNVSLSEEAHWPPPSYPPPIEDSEPMEIVGDDFELPKIPDAPDFAFIMEEAILPAVGDMAEPSTPYSPVLEFPTTPVQIEVAVPLLDEGLLEVYETTFSDIVEAVLRQTEVKEGQLCYIVEFTDGREEEVSRTLIRYLLYAVHGEYSCSACCVLRRRLRAPMANVHNMTARAVLYPRKICRCALLYLLDALFHELTWHRSPTTN